MTKLFARIKVIASTAVTWLIALGLVANQLAGQVGDLGTVGATVAAWSLRIATGIATAVLIIRRVTPVLDTAERGILPTPNQGA